jgi:hypothetical protein
VLAGEMIGEIGMFLASTIVFDRTSFDVPADLVEKIKVLRHTFATFEDQFIGKKIMQ